MVSRSEGGGQGPRARLEVVAAFHTAVEFEALGTRLEGSHWLPPLQDGFPLGTRVANATTVSTSGSGNV